MSIEEIVDRFLSRYVPRAEHEAARKTLGTLVELAELRGHRKELEHVIASGALALSVLREMKSALKGEEDAPPK